MKREQDNIEVVRGLYAAFSKGDLEAVLASLAEDIEWIESGPQDEVPWCGTHQGKVALRAFFAKVFETLQVERFEPRDFLAKGEKVVVLGEERCRAKATGKPYESAWTHIFTVRDGKVATFHQLIDTAAVAAAYRSA